MATEPDEAGTVTAAVKDWVPPGPRLTAVGAMVMDTAGGVELGDVELVFPLPLQERRIGTASKTRAGRTGGTTEILTLI